MSRTKKFLAALVFVLGITAAATAPAAADNSMPTPPRGSAGASR
ncbi:hypothetical protein AB0O01_07530 [Streptomyces sp. NPDC093252]